MDAVNGIFVFDHFDHFDSELLVFKSCGWQCLAPAYLDIEHGY